MLLFLQYVSELGFHIARLFYFTDENHQKMWVASLGLMVFWLLSYFTWSHILWFILMRITDVSISSGYYSTSHFTFHGTCCYCFVFYCVPCFRFDLWAVSFVFTRMATLTLMFLAVGFGLARSENQGLDLEMGNFNTVLIRWDGQAVVNPNNNLCVLRCVICAVTFYSCIAKIQLEPIKKYWLVCVLLFYYIHSQQSQESQHSLTGNNFNLRASPISTP